MYMPHPSIAMAHETLFSHLCKPFISKKNLIFVVDNKVTMNYPRTLIKVPILFLKLNGLCLAPGTEAINNLLPIQNLIAADSRLT